MRAASSQLVRHLAHEHAHQPRARSAGSARRARGPAPCRCCPADGAEHDVPGAGQRDRRDHVEDERPAQQAEHDPGRPAQARASSRPPACGDRGTRPCSTTRSAGCCRSCGGSPTVLREQQLVEVEQNVGVNRPRPQQRDLGLERRGRRSRRPAAARSAPPAISTSVHATRCAAPTALMPARPSRGARWQAQRHERAQTMNRATTEIAEP